MGKAAGLVFNVNRERKGKFHLAGRIRWGGNYGALPIKQKFWQSVFLSESEVRKPRKEPVMEENKVGIETNVKQEKKGSDRKATVESNVRNHKERDETVMKTEKSTKAAKKAKKAIVKKAAPQTAKREGNVAAKAKKDGQRYTHAPAEGTIGGLV